MLGTIVGPLDGVPVGTVSIVGCTELVTVGTADESGVGTGLGG